MVVSERQVPSASDHDFNIEHIIPSVNHRMNMRSDAGDSLCSGGEEGGGCVYVSIQDTTFDPSTGIKHAANLLCAMRNSIGTNESSCPFYLIGLETDGSSDHNHKDVRNQLALSGLFILGKLNRGLILIEDILGCDATVGIYGLNFLYFGINACHRG